MSKRTNVNAKPAAKPATGRKRAAKPAPVETPVLIFAPRQRDVIGHSNKHRVYVEYHRAVCRGDNPVNIETVRAVANATGIKLTTVRSWVADWRSAAPRGIPGTIKSTPLHAAAHGGDVAKMRAALVAYDKTQQPTA